MEKIRDRAAQLQSEKTLKRLPVVDLEFRLFIRQVIEPLQNQDFEHQHHVIRFATGRRLPVFVEHGGQLRPKNLKINMALQRFQRILQPGQFRETFRFIEETRLVNIHAISNAGMMPNYWLPTD